MLSTPSFYLCCITIYERQQCKSFSFNPLWCGHMFQKQGPPPPAFIAPLLSVLPEAVY